MDAALLEDTMLHIRSYPELHNQSYYYEQSDYGLCACFAGRALLLAGYSPVMTYGIRGCIAAHPTNGTFVNVWTEARERLGIEDKWAANLFTPQNTRRMLDLKVKDLLNGSPLRTYRELLSVGS